MLIKVGSHWDEAVSLLLTQYQNSPKFLSILSAVTSQGDHVEDLLWAVLTHLDFRGRISDLPTGPRLDRVGSVANVPRFDAETDDDYLRRINQEVGIDAASTPEEILRLVKAFTGDPRPYYIPEYPARYVVFTHVKKAIPMSFLNSISAGGVRGLHGIPIMVAGRRRLMDTQGRQLLAVCRVDAQKLAYAMIGNTGEAMVGNNSETMVGAILNA